MASSASENGITSESCANDSCGVAFCNVGVPRGALTGQSCKTYTSLLTKMIHELLTDHPFLIELCFCECDVCGEGYDANARSVFEAAIVAGFLKSDLGMPVFFYTDEMAVARRSDATGSSVGREFGKHFH